MRVVWTPASAGELVEILDYVRARSPSGAARLRDRIRRIEAVIAQFPDHGRAVRGHPTLRRTTVPPYPYVIFYDVLPAAIFIRRLRHTSRRPEPPPG